MVAAATNPIRQAQTAADASYSQQQQNVTGLSQALAQILQGIAPGVQQTYQNASDAQAAYAKGFSDQVQQAQQQRATDTSGFLSKIGAPDSQIAGVQQQVNPAGAGDTLYGLRGYIPASTLNEEGAAYTANARQLPQVAFSQGLQQIAGIRSAQQKADAQFAQQIAQEAGKAPQYRLDVQKLADSEANTAFNQAATKARLQQGQSRLDLQSQMDAFNQKYKIANLNLASQKFAQQTVNQDRTYTLNLRKLGITQRKLQLQVAAQEYKLNNGGFTPVEINKFKTSAFNIATNAFNGRAAVYDPNNPKTIKQAALQPVSYQTAIKEMRSAGVPLSLAIPALVEAGYKPGVRGAPFDEAAAPPVQGPGLGDRTSQIVRAASSMLGTPYQWGGNVPGKALDCSAFVQQTYAKLGVKLPRTTYAQVKVGTPVSLNQLQPGDAVFTEPGKNGPNHVGLYIGNGMVQESPHTGDVNKIIPLQSFLSGGFVAARRYVGH